MKKSKRLRQAEAGWPSAPATGTKRFVWWPWAAALAGLFLAFAIYGPALNGPFVLDDLYLPFGNPKRCRSGLPAVDHGTRGRS